MRAEGWEARLAEYLESAPPFAWGTNDCALWAAGWVALCTGDNFRGDWLGRYATERGAKLRMARLGFASVADIADRHLPVRLVPLARRGDLLLHPAGPLGICAGRTGHFLAADGVTAVDTLACPRAWGVG